MLNLDFSATFLRSKNCGIRWTTALCSVGLACQATSTLAQDHREATLPPVVVTASGFEQDVSEAPASITVISRKDLENRSFRDLTDALRDVEGVAVTGIANEKDIYIRGLAGTYTLILVDGKRQNTRATRANGDAGLEQSFIPPLEAIERIEVVRGPMSSLYGSDAMGGVINVITRKVPSAWEGSVGADYTLQQHGSSGDSYQGQFYFGGPVKNDLLGLQIWGRQYGRQEDAILNGFSGARDRDLTARLAITPNPHNDILLEAGTTDVRRTATPRETLEATDSATENRYSRDHYSLSHSGRYGWGTSEISLSYERAQRDTYTLNSLGVNVHNPRAPLIENTVLDAKLTAPLGNHLVVFGGQWFDANLHDQNPGKRNDKVESFDIVQKALFVEDEWKLTKAWSLTGGLRLNDHAIYGQNWSPRLYSVWQATDSLTIKGGVSRGFRAPEIRTIAPGYAYTTGGARCTYGPKGTCGVIIGDPKLKPETSTSYEVAAYWNNKSDLSASATLFYTEFKDKIANALVYNADGTIARWSEDPNYRLWYSYNINNANIAGTELSTRWQATKALAFKASYTFTDSVQKGGSYDGYPLTRTPKNMFSLRTDWEATPGLTIWSTYVYHGSEVNAGARIGSNGTYIADGVRKYGGYGLFDVGASYALNSKTTLNFAIYNIGDKRLDDLVYNTGTDGRRAWIGVNAKF